MVLRWFVYFRISPMECGSGEMSLIDLGSSFVVYLNKPYRLDVIRKTGNGKREDAHNIYRRNPTAM